MSSARIATTRSGTPTSSPSPRHANSCRIFASDSLYLYYSGYDPTYARYSVMTTVVAEAIKFAIANGFRTVNLSTGSDESKLRWKPRVRIYREASLVSPSLRGAVAHDSYAWVRRTFERRPVSNPLAAYLYLVRPNTQT